MAAWLTPDLLAVFALETLSLATVAEAQPYGPGPGGSGNIMGEGWGWVGEWVGSERLACSWSLWSSWVSLCLGSVAEISNPYFGANELVSSSRRQSKKSPMTAASHSTWAAHI
jgi:hypothetical protein